MTVEQRREEIQRIDAELDACTCRDLNYRDCKRCQKRYSLLEMHELILEREAIAQYGGG